MTNVEATDWTLHKVNADHARLRSAKRVGPHLEFLRTSGAETAWNRVHLDLMPYPVTIKRRKWPGCGPCVLVHAEGEPRPAWPLQPFYKLRGASSEQD